MRVYLIVSQQPWGLKKRNSSQKDPDFYATRIDVMRSSQTHHVKSEGAGLDKNYVEKVPVKSRGWS